MSSLTDLLQQRTALDAADVEWLRLLVGDWQLLSDLSFADLVLWVPVPQGWLAVAHVRPTTGATAFVDDTVGTGLPVGRRAQIDQAYATSRICRERDPDWRDDVPVREETIPVVRAGRAVAVLSRHTNLATMRMPSRLELTYLDCASLLARMVAHGDFPVPDAATGPRRGAPRVGDGMIRLDDAGVVRFASPNAVSAFHRLGHERELVGRQLAPLVAALLDSPDPVDEALPLVLGGRAPWRGDLEASGTSLSVRAIPLTLGGGWQGALLLARDVTELRRREQQLLSKDATIREIHHRVKNNLQTVAALLRLQGRRLADGTARAALAQAERRVAAIALVHEALSAGYEEAVDFDEVAGRGLAMAVEVARPGGVVRVVRQGRFGRLRADDATALSLVLNELVHNAVEHGLAGRDGCVTLSAQRDGQQPERLVVVVADDGVGMGQPQPTQRPGLGSQIVAALVTELGGVIRWDDGPVGGTAVTVEVVLRTVDEERPSVTAPRPPAAGA